MKISSRYTSLLLPAAAVCAFAASAFLIIDSGLLGRKTTGSFEYIRKGEALMDKGKYLDAIGYHETAHASSPDNAEIASALVYAYSKYAMKAAESEKYDLGIEYMSKAYDTAVSAYTKQNLSLMYAKRAAYRARNSDRAGAQGDLDTAVEIADGSAVCGKNLGIALFNDAVEEFKAAREDNAIMLVRAALSVYGDSRIYEFLGDIYYRKTDLGKAGEYFGKAAKLDPGNKKLAGKSEKVSKEEALSGKEKASVIANFDLRYTKGLPVDPFVTARILEKAFSDVGGDLAYFPGTRTVVFFYSEKDFREIFKMRDLVRAFYDGNIRIPLPAPIADEKELVSYLYHEYTHAIVSAKTNNNCPVWLSEGIAVYEEFKWTRPGAAVNIPADVKIPEISIQELDKMFKDPAISSDKLVLAYMLAYTLVDYISYSWGMRKLDKALGAIALGAHAVNAMDDEFLLSEKEFDRKWSDFVMEKYVKKRRLEQNNG
ncbi:MAG: hypothetical protein V1682_02265 [Candidatus Omnitrophota bacterium]